MLSVIIPVYNGEKWLGRCLDSVCKQTIYSELEIVIINDGSQDNSQAIIDRFAAENKNVRAFRIPNQGVSNARNQGIDISVGEYISFLDADDYLDPDWYESLLAAMTPETDIVCGGYTVEYGENVSVVHRREERRISSNQEIMRAFLQANGVDQNVWNKLFRRKAIGNTRFDTTLSISEDKRFVFDVSMGAKAAQLCAAAGYHYVINHESAIHSKISHHKLRNVLDVAGYMREQIAAKYPLLSNCFECAYVDIECRLSAEIFAAKAQDRFCNEYRQMRADIRRFSLLKKCKYSSKKHTLALLAAKISPSFYLYLRKNLKLQYK